MEFLILVAVILAGNIVQSAIALMFASRNREIDPNDIVDVLMEARYSRLTSELAS